VNNFNYAMTGGQVAPTTPLEARSTTSPYGCFEHPFNLPLLAASSGAVYVARWTALHIRRTSWAMAEAMKKRGFSFVEIISPCPTVYGRRNKLGTGLDLMKFYHDNVEIRHGADPREAAIEFQKKILVGKFVDIEKPTFIDQMNSHLNKILGDKYVPWGVRNEQE
jgi:2-oxoglutarate ferredoxin oxidoreductase subunit beta